DEIAFSRSRNAAGFRPHAPAKHEETSMPIPSPAALRMPIALVLAAGSLLPCVTEAADPRGWAVVSDQARFEVLSPRLIRTEFAGDRQFQDAGTFNVVGRGNFSQPQFSADRSNGWLTITTAAMVLRYR